MHNNPHSSRMSPRHFNRPVKSDNNRKSLLWPNFMRRHTSRGRWTIFLAILVVFIGISLFIFLLLMGAPIFNWNSESKENFLIKLDQIDFSTFETSWEFWIALIFSSLISLGALVPVLLILKPRIFNMKFSGDLYGLPGKWNVISAYEGRIGNRGTPFSKILFQRPPGTYRRFLFGTEINSTNGLFFQDTNTTKDFLNTMYLSGKPFNWSFSYGQAPFFLRNKHLANVHMVMDVNFTKLVGTQLNSGFKRKKALIRF